MENDKRNLLIFTGAGVSAESGLKTFRDNNGLWDTYRVEDVATPQAWHKNPNLVLEFYNFRRAELTKAKPNLAHIIIAALEKHFNLTLVTQNVDNLHEQGGSDPKNIVHLHGSLVSYTNPSKTERWPWPEGKEIKLGDLDPKGNQLRPDIVWFGEMLHEADIEAATLAAAQADVCIIVGTSMQVFPASQIPWLTPDECKIYYIDPQSIGFHIPRERKANFEHIQNIASEGMVGLYHELTGVEWA